MNGKNYEVGLDTACAGTTSYVVRGPAHNICKYYFISQNIFQKLAKVQAPLFMLNGFYVKGLSTNFNIGGTDSRDDLMARYVLVKDNTGAIIGCTSNLLV